MIIGTGIDLVDMRRIRALIEKHEARFLAKYFTIAEIEHIDSIELPEKRLLSICKRFAAKEAGAKALGTGFQSGIYMIDIEVANDALGKPALYFHNGALAYLMSLLPEQEDRHMGAKLHLSMTDEPPYAQAQVIIEAF